MSSETETVYYRDQFVDWRCFSFEIFSNTTVKLLKLLRVEDSVILHFVDRLASLYTTSDDGYPISGW